MYILHTCKCKFFLCFQRHFSSRAVLASQLHPAEPSVSAVQPSIFLLLHDSRSVRVAALITSCTATCFLQLTVTPVVCDVAGSTRGYDPLALSSYSRGSGSATPGNMGASQYSSHSNHSGAPGASTGE